MRIKPKDFQKMVREGKQIDAFEATISDKILPILTKAKKLLTYCKDSNTDGLPHFVVSKICDSAPEVVFMLMYRLMLCKDEDNLSKENSWSGHSICMVRERVQIKEPWTADEKYLPCNDFFPNWGLLVFQDG